ncbi:class I SAM-dependent methyltransferase [Nocardioides sp. SYSU DS0651]|uniref:class I SAM-dependent methyltransferase n=1 Tax=Nocardioides sp. SYSU DS0651 TaxID=3415955 RepID=UPI003F4C702D
MARRSTRSKKYVNASRVQLKRQMQRFAKGTRPGMLVLDAGAGRSPYRKLFKHAQYEAADFAQLGTDYAPLDYVCDITDIPVEDERFDRVVFNQVMEHLPEPDRALAELHRVLKPGGRLFCSVPLFFPEHQVPYDFYRYTQFALRRLFEEAGFEIMRIEWLEGYFGTVAYQFKMMHGHLPADLGAVRALGVGRKRALTVAPTILFTRWLAGRLSRFYADAETHWKYTDGGMPKNYVVVAQKPKGAATAG